MNFSVASPRTGVKVLEQSLTKSLTTIATFFEDLFDVSGNEWFIAAWFRSRQRLHEVDRIVTALL